MASPLGGVAVKELSGSLRPLGLSESQVSRVEHGNVGVPLCTVRGYERLLDLPYGELQAPLLALARVVNDPQSRRWLESLVSDTTPRHIVDEIFDAEEDGLPISGSQWLRFAHAVAAGRCEALPSRMLFRWVRRLISEMMRGVNGGYFSRIEAASTLAAHHSTAAPLLRAVRELTSVPGVSGAYDAWSVVGDIRKPQLLEQLIEPLGKVQESTFRAFCSALTQPLLDERLTEEQTARIAAACAARLETASRHTTEAIDRLAVFMPAGLGGPLLKSIDSSRPRTRVGGFHDDRDVDAEVAVYMRHATESAWPGRPDGQLEALLRVMLVGANYGQRIHIGSTLWVSPYAAALAEAALTIIGSDDFGVAQQDAALFVLSRTAAAPNRDSLWAVLRDSERADVRNACLLALAHTHGIDHGEDITPYLHDPETRWTTIYAAGITGHPQLGSAEADSPDAQWWLSVGPGFWD